MHHARATLREQGYRLTPQRTAIWEALRAAGRHMTAEEVTDEVRERIPEVNTSTVYRTLELLVSLDLVTETKLGTSRSYFEVSPDPSHHHFVCECCGFVGHFGDALFAPLYETLAALDGFRPTHARATVFGLCKSCQTRAQEPPHPPTSHAHP
jgi:Fur family transcriptional regulator, ferric uptake regulator